MTAEGRFSKPIGRQKISDFEKCESAELGAADNSSG
jgi:hypothetical protein